MTRNSANDEGVRAFLRPPMGNYASYSREYLATVRSCVMKAWPTSGPNATKREVALTLLSDPELRLRICHLEDILRARQLSSRQQMNGCPGSLTNGVHSVGAGGGAHSSSSVKDSPPVQLQTALANPSFAALFELDSTVNDPDWGMQVLWLNMSQLLKELGLPPPPPPPPSPSTLSPSAAPPPGSPHAQVLPLTHGSPSSSSSGTPVNRTQTAVGFGDGGGGGIRGVGSPSPPAPEPSLLYGIEATFPNYPIDDEDYLAVSICFCLATRRDPKALLPPFSLHLPDLCAHLCAFAAVDSRLALALQRLVNGGGGGRRAASGSGGTVAPQTLISRVSEVLAAGARTRPLFRQSESLSRKGERVVSLAVEQLLRAAAGRAGCSGGGGGQILALGNLPLGAWQRASGGGGSVAAAAAAPEALSAGGGGGAPDGLPVFLFEYEAPGDLYGRDDMAHPLAARRDQYGSMDAVRISRGGDGGVSPTGRPRTSSATAVPATSGGCIDSGGDILRTVASAHSRHPRVQQQLLTQKHQLQLQHAWSDGSTPLAVAVPGGGGSDAPAGLNLQHSAFEPVSVQLQLEPHQVAGAVQVQATCRSSEAKASMLQRGQGAVGGGGSGGGGGPAADVLAGGYSGLGLGLGAEWEVGKAAEEGRQERSFGGALRFPVLDGSGVQPSASSTLGGFPDAIFHPSLAPAPAAVLAASPGAPTGELQVPQEIAEVWSNAANGAGGGGNGGGGGGPRRSSASITSNGLSSGLGAVDGALGGVFAMSPTQESYMWERAAPRSSLHQINETAAVAAAVGRSGTIDQCTFGLSLGLSYSTHDGGGGLGGSGGGLGGVAASGGGFLVGSAPPSSALPPFILGPGGGLTGQGLFDCSTWQSCSPELSSSVGGRSALADDTSAAGSWLLAHGARVHGGCGGGGGGSAASGRMLAAAGGGGVGVGAAEAGGVVVTARAMTGPSPSVSEESEEAASVVGGLELDPVALTLEFIGLEQLEPGAVNRRTTLTRPGPTATVMPAKGLIAAAAAPKAGQAAVATPAASGSLTAQSPLSAAPTADGSSLHSSLDSGEALNAAGGPASANAVLTGWSAMAARGPATASSHAASVSMQLAAAAAAASGGSRIVGSTLSPHVVLTPPGSTAISQGLAATLAAMGGGSAVASGGPAPLSRVGGGGLVAAAGVGMAGLGSGAAVSSSGGGVAGAGAGGRDVLSGKVLHPKLTARVREEICQLLRTLPGLKVEDFDDGVLHQLTLKKSEDEAVGALRTLASENLSGIQHMAAYINHIIKNYHLTGGLQGSGGAAGATAASLPSATVRANSTPVSSKAILQKLPLRVYRRLEEVINKCSYMEWKHFDAGVVKVMAQLAEIGEEDVFEELELLKSTDLSNVEYMPAYLNKRLNNRLWSRRKMLTSATAAVGGAGA